MIRTTLLAALIICVVSAATIAQQDDPAGQLKQLGVAMQMYAIDHKGYFPPDLASLKKYYREWESAQRDFVYAVAPGTRMTKVGPPGETPVALTRVKRGQPLYVLFADGHVQAFMGVKLEEPANTPAAATTQPMRARAPGPAIVANRDVEAPTTVPADLSAALVGAWTTDVGDYVATYQFTANGKFTLRFGFRKPSRSPVPGVGQASGTWKLDGRKLVMTNAASDTPFTVVGENEEAEIIGLNENVLVLKTVDAKGQAEQAVLRRGIVFEKGKHDNAKILGTWSGNGTTLVLAESGMMVCGPLKGQWMQRGTILNLVAGNAAGTSSHDLYCTIDLVDDTTLVLTGKFEGERTQTVTFLRVK